MKPLLRLLFVVLATYFLTGCLFKEPVFTEGFAKIDPALAGVWATEGKQGDPRKVEFAVHALLDPDRALLHHPAGEKGGIYYESRQVIVRDRTLLQLRVLATFSDGLPKTDEERYTLLWVDKSASDSTLQVRALGGDGLKDKSPAEVRQLLNAPETDWNGHFGEAMRFHRLPDR